jgi:hypothetical protein
MKSAETKPKEPAPPIWWRCPCTGGGYAHWLACGACGQPKPVTKESK